MKLVEAIIISAISIMFFYGLFSIYYISVGFYYGNKEREANNTYQINHYNSLGKVDIQEKEYRDYVEVKMPEYTDREVFLEQILFKMLNEKMQEVCGESDSNKWNTAEIDYELRSVFIYCNDDGSFRESDYTISL